MKKYDKRDHRAFARWAADCAGRVLPLFEKEYPKDGRPREAVEACRTWVRTGLFRMAEVRKAALAAHAAARRAPEAGAARFAARAAGQAMAAAHVTQHALASAIYALKAIAAAGPAEAETQTAKEREWQLRHLPRNLRGLLGSSCHAARLWRRARP